MYSLWKEVSEQIKKKAEDLNNTFQELNINNTSKDTEKYKDDKINENNSDKTLKGSIHEKLNLINNKYLNKDLCELNYYNNKFINGFNNIKKIVGDIYKDKLNNINNDDEDKKKLYLSKIVPWKKADIMISKIYRKKYDEGFPINLPDNNLNNEVYEKILKLNLDRNRILNTNILENYNFNWLKKKEQSEKIIQEDENLLVTKSFLVPYYMSEMNFWKSYFFNIDIIYNEIADEIYENKKNILMSYDSEYAASGFKNQSIYQSNNYLLSENSLHNFEHENTTKIFEDKSNLNNFKIEDTLNNLNEVNNINNFKEKKSLDFKDETNEQNLKIENNMNKWKEEDNSCKVSSDINISNISSLDEFIYLKNRKGNEIYSHLNENSNNSDILSKNNVDNNIIEPQKNNNPISNKCISKCIDDEKDIKKAKINGLNIYMDNDIYKNLRKQSNNFSKFLNNSDHDDKKKEDIIFSSDKKENCDNLIHEYFNVSEKNIKRNAQQNESISIKEKVDNSTSLNKLDSSPSISECNLKLLEEIKESNRKAYKNENENNSCELLSSIMNSNEVKRNINTTYEWVDKISNDLGENNEDKKNNNIPIFISYKNEDTIIESDQNEEEIKNNYKNSVNKEMGTDVTSNNKKDLNVEIENYRFGEKEDIQIEDKNEERNTFTNKNMLENAHRDNKLLNPIVKDNNIYKEFKNEEKSYELKCINIKEDSFNSEPDENKNVQSDNFLNGINSMNVIDGINMSDEKKRNKDMSQLNSWSMKEQNFFNHNENNSDEKISLNEDGLMGPNINFDTYNSIVDKKINVPKKEDFKNNDDITAMEQSKKENNLKEDFYFDDFNNSANFRNIKETKENINFNVDDLIDLSTNKDKNDTNNFLKSSDINLDEINFGDDIEFDFDSNKFNAEELEQFEKDLLNA